MTNYTNIIIQIFNANENSVLLSTIEDLKKELSRNFEGTIGYDYISKKVYFLQIEIDTAIRNRKDAWNNFDKDDYYHKSKILYDEILNQIDILQQFA